MTANDFASLSQSEREKGKEGGWKKRDGKKDRESQGLSFAIFSAKLISSKFSSLMKFPFKSTQASQMKSDKFARYFTVH